MPLPDDLRADIESVVHRYATAIDRRDWDLFRTAFSEDAQIDYGPLMGSFVGTDAFTEFMRQAHAPAGRSLHRMTSIVITSTDPIRAQTYGDSIVLHASDESLGDHGAASYDDEFVRTPAGLRISRRTAQLVLFEPISGNRALTA
jgi:hypothetical protein